MTDSNGIPIRNIYWMLTYAFSILRQTNYQRIAAEEFENTEDMFAAILCRGISQQIKHGLYREYAECRETSPVLRGRLDINTTVGQKLRCRQRLGCIRDELSQDNIYNRILKTTAAILSATESVKPELRSELKRIMRSLSGISTIQPSEIKWSTLGYRRANATYDMLIKICRFVLEGLLQTTDDGKYRIRHFTDDHMSQLYERFVREYYKRHHPELKVASKRIAWNLDEGTDNEGAIFLPSMLTDITLQYEDRTLIIDTKYYSKTMAVYHDSRKLHSENMYQIFAYVKNCDKTGSSTVSGILLYAGTGESQTPDCMYSIGGNRIGAKTLDLAADFTDIAATLDNIAATELEQKA